MEKGVGFMMLIKKVEKGGALVLLLLPAALVILPILILLSGSMMDALELKGYLTSVFTGGDRFISWKLLPDFPSFANYGKLLFETPQFFVLFWNSMKLVYAFWQDSLSWRFRRRGGLRCIR